MKTKPQNLKPPKERMEILLSLAGRNLPQEIARELLDQEKRIGRLERVVQKLLNLQKERETV